MMEIFLVCNPKCGVTLSGKIPVVYNSDMAEFQVGTSHLGQSFRFMLSRATLEWAREQKQKTGISTLAQFREARQRIIKYMELEVIGNVFENAEL